MSDSLEFRLLKYILAVAETLNFTRAAQPLFLAQPSLSKQIRDLEIDFRFPLFERSRDGIRLTNAGRIVIAYRPHRQLCPVQRVLRELQKAENARGREAYRRYAHLATRRGEGAPIRPFDAGHASRGARRNRPAVDRCGETAPPRVRAVLHAHVLPRFLLPSRHCRGSHLARTA